MRGLLKLALLLVVGLLAYNYFYGTAAERRQSERFVDKARDLGNDAWDLLRSEKQKLDRGKYDDALDRLEDLYADLRKQVGRIGDRDFAKELERLTDRRSALEKVVDRGGELSEAAKDKLDELTADTEELMHEMEAQSKSTAPR